MLLCVVSAVSKKEVLFSDSWRAVIECINNKNMKPWFMTRRWRRILMSRCVGRKNIHSDKFSLDL